MAANRRVKSDKAEAIISDWAEVDLSIRNIGDLQSQIAGAEQDAAEAINKVKIKLAEKTKPLQETLNWILCGLETFAASHKTDFKDQKSLKLNFGTLGWRKSSFITIKKTTLDLIKKFLPQWLAKLCIHTKESVNKEALAKLTDEQLVKVAARREEKDVFFVEPSVPEAAKYPKDKE